MGNGCSQGNDVRLRPVEPGNARLVARWKSDPYVRRMALDPETDISEAGEEEDLRRALASSDQQYMIVMLRETGEPIGYVRVNWLDPSRRIAWLRLALGEHRGQGLGRQALVQFLERLFSEGAHRVEAEVYAFNEAGRRLLVALGFKQEGMKRQAHHDGQRYHDVIVFGLLAEDWCSGGRDCADGNFRRGGPADDRGASGPD